MAVPVHVSHTTAGPVSQSSTFTGDLPASTAAGDLLIACIASDLTQLVATGTSTGSPSGPSGWTELHSATVRTSGGDVSAYVWWKIAGASEPATYSWTFTSATGWGTVTIHRITGVDTTTPIDVSSVTTTVAGVTSVPLASVTTTVADTLLLALTAADESASAGLADDTYFANPMISGWTQIDRAAWSGTTAYVVIGAASSSQASPGATGTQVASITSLNDAIVGYLIAVRPASGVTSHAVTATGTLATDGTATLARTTTLGSTGTVVTDGTAALARTTTMSATGSLATDGTADLRVVKHLTSSGSLVTDGTAALRLTTTIAATGTLSTDGTATLARTTTITATGTVVTDGTADIVITGPGATVWPITATGAVVTDGSATLRLTASVGASGSLTTDGSATLAMRLVMAATGGLATDGSVSFVPVLTGATPPFHVDGMTVGGSNATVGPRRVRTVKAQGRRIRTGGG